MEQSQDLGGIVRNSLYDHHPLSFEKLARIHNLNGSDPRISQTGHPRSDPPKPKRGLGFSTYPKRGSKHSLVRTREIFKKVLRCRLRTTTKGGQRSHQDTPHTKLPPNGNTWRSNDAMITTDRTVGPYLSKYLVMTIIAFRSSDALRKGVCALTKPALELAPSTTRSCRVSS